MNVFPYEIMAQIRLMLVEGASRMHNKTGDATGPFTPVNITPNGINVTHIRKHMILCNMYFRFNPYIANREQYSCYLVCFQAYSYFTVITNQNFHPKLTKFQSSMRYG